MEQITSKLKSYASILEPKTRAQACQTASMDFVQPYLALMPDAHLGKGATVGSVIPTVGAIMPAAVGVDIGCGMDAVLTQFKWSGLQKDGDADLFGLDLTALRESIEQAIPLSAGNYNKSTTKTASLRQDKLADFAARNDVVPTEFSPNWHLQLGSLGSGNHFIEITVDELDRVWLFLHSGSRGVGNKMAQKFITVAKQQCAGESFPDGNRDLSYLKSDTDAFEDYIDHLWWAQLFAKLNREEMMDRVESCFSVWAGENVQRKQTISCHHNYTSVETHFGQQVWLSRKGAIDAHEGVWGLIPGSMGAASYVVRGKGNTEALCSAPHGAGREHSRGQAKKLFNMEDLTARMEGIEWSGRDAFLDEHPSAYKDIDVVMQDAAPMVETVHTFRQIVNIKGD